MALVTGIASAGTGCPVALTVSPGQFVSLTANPSGSYTYLWTYPGTYGTTGSNTEITNPSQDETAGTNKATLTFKAPITPGTYTLTSLVTSTVAGATSCVDSCSVTLTVEELPACPTNVNVCVDSPPAHPATPPTYTYTGHTDASLIYTWFVNSVQASQLTGAGPWTIGSTEYTKPTFILDWNNANLVKPTTAGASTDNTMTFVVTDTSSTTISTCTWHIFLYKSPDATIAHTP
jgi:hypothetical protein